MHFETYYYLGSCAVACALLAQVLAKCKPEPETCGVLMQSIHAGALVITLPLWAPVLPPVASVGFAAQWVARKLFPSAN